MVCIMSEYVGTCTISLQKHAENPCQQIEVTLIRDQDPDIMDMGTQTSAETDDSENQNPSSIKDGDYMPTDADSESSKSQGSSGLDDTSADADDEWSDSQDKAEDSTDDDNDSTKWCSDEQEMVKGCPKLKRKRSHSPDGTKRTSRTQGKHRRQNQKQREIENPDHEDLDHGEEALSESPDDGTVLRRDVATRGHKLRI